MVTSDEFKLFLGGESGRHLLFNYNQTALSRGLFKMLGQMILHSVCQGCTGFPFLASMYCYVATADIYQAAIYASLYYILDETELMYMYVKNVNVSMPRLY